MRPRSLPYRHVDLRKIFSLEALSFPRLARERPRSVLELPPDKRRPLSSRVDEILAHPYSGPCERSCPLCSDIKPTTAQAALMVWDDLARSGIWPIRPGTIIAFLRENKLAGSEGAGFKRIKKFLNHRRTRVLQALVRAELARWGGTCRT
jgi:hypothetical protein